MNFINIFIDPIGLASLLLGINALFHLFSFLILNQQKSEHRWSILAFMFIHFALALLINQEWVWGHYLTFLFPLLDGILLARILKKTTTPKWINYSILILDLLLVLLMFYAIFIQNQ